MPLSLDERMMQRALQLAERGLGHTWPNPMVGAVVVKNGRVVGQGYHHRAGEPHAEVLALREAGRAARGATLYINLEPCSHFGRTPPCAPAVAASGIKRVVAAMRDPNPKVSGRGCRCLQQAGVTLEVGLLAEPARRLNAVFLKNILTPYPFVVCKAAQSLDGKIACANGQSQWISGRPARVYAHRLRAIADAVLVGMGTLLQDDPELTTRLAKPLKERRHLRVVLEGRRQPTDYPDRRLLKKVKTNPVIIATAHAGERHPLAGHPGVEIWALPGPDGVDLPALLARLKQAGVNYLLVEGGAGVHASFLGQNPGGLVLADQVQFVLAPKIIGGRQSPGPVGGAGVDHPDHALRIRDLSIEKLGDDYLAIGRPVSPFPAPRKRTRRRS